jgi:hypothetical protein
MNDEWGIGDMSTEMRLYLAKMASDICPHCDTPFTDQRQVGRCVYAVPCYCRLYQGTIDPRFKKPEKIHPYFQEQLDKGV